MEEIIDVDDFYAVYEEQIVSTLEKTKTILCELENSRIEHLKYRIKSKSSSIAKLKKLNLEQTADDAMHFLTDIIGIRIVCRFWNDVFQIANDIKAHKKFNVILSKNYIDYPKENGYRSYHIIVEVSGFEGNIPVEIQIRTISQDSWASLEHQLKYKKELTHNQLIQGELKRLADEMTATDLCMQTIKELIDEEELV